MTAPETVRHHYRACNLCEAICGLDIAVRGDTIQSIRGDKDDTFSRGHICPKAVALQDVHADPDRLRYPLRRTRDGWERIGWDRAFDEVASRLKDIQTRHGRDAVGTYLGNPTVHNYGSMLFLRPLLQALRSRNRFSATSLDQLPHMLASALVFGHPLLFPVPDVDRTGCFVIMGGNPAVSNGSMMTAPDIKTRLRAIRERGGQVIVIDPRHTETAQLADRHLFIRPGTDALLLLAVLHTLRTEGLARPGRLDPLINGLETFWKSVDGITPEMVAPITGVEPGAIRALAQTFATAPSAVWYGRMGVCTQEFGALSMWLIYAINIVTGNLDRAGGAMFARPTVDPIALKLARFGGFGRWHSRVRGLPEFDDELPTAAMTEEMLTPGAGQVRALFTLAGNPVLSSPNGKQLEKALAGLEFMVSVDIYLNETTRHAHIILPPTASLEHENYDLAFHLLAVRNTARFSPALFEPAADTRHDWEILLELQTRLRSNSPASGVRARFRRAVLRRLGPQGILDLGLRFGPYGSGLRFWKDGLSLRRLKQAPHGIDLGPLVPCLPDRLLTASKKIELVPEVFRTDLARLKARFLAPACSAETSLVLIGRRHTRSNNSWMHNAERLVRGEDRCTLLIHPLDGARLGIASGQRIRVTSRAGSIEVPAEVSDEVMPGVVSLPHGWGHTREGTRLGTAELHAGASVNDITDELALDALSGNAAFSGVRVTVVPSGPRSD